MDKVFRCRPAADKASDKPTQSPLFRRIQAGNVYGLGIHQLRPD